MNLRLLSLLLCVNLLACSTPTVKIDPEAAQTDGCTNAPLTQQENCQQQRYQANDAGLNQLYKNLRQQLSPLQNQALRQAQRLWLPYRDLHCAHAIAEQQAHLQTRLKYQCLAQITQTRVTELPIYQSPNTPPENLNYPETDQQLNQLYREQMRNLSKPQQQSLRQAQRAWLAFRDAECAAQQSLGISKNACLARLTQSRTQQLQQPLLANTETKTLQLTETNLLGNWQRLQYKGDLRLNFGVRNGIHYYAAQLEQLPHEAGQWQLKQDQLNITDSRGQLLYAYQVLGLTDEILLLQDVDGSVAQYKKLKD